ncbi:MAG: hypothetical protein QKC66_gp2 [Anelloviridae sp.]|uniref:DUF755 domain-containing protein n=1 Tax=Anelloviridae sp. TaxID=2055263 RepID=A0A385E1E8_9VIRU|nr:MAG: hypothetical protein QKC66_gp2 [Anelloviridae sp.]AXQ65613.1 MAG: hypothetical protein [Anelloviridae sp.]
MNQIRCRVRNQPLKTTCTPLTGAGTILPKALQKEWKSCQNLKSLLLHLQDSMPATHSQHPNRNQQKGHRRRRKKKRKHYSSSSNSSESSNDSTDTRSSD